jgi:hypothetical protein
MLAEYYGYLDIMFYYFLRFWASAAKVQGRIRSRAECLSMIATFSFIFVVIVYTAVWFALLLHFVSNFARTRTPVRRPSGHIFNKKGTVSL